MDSAEDHIDAGWFHRLIVHGHMHTGPHFTPALLLIAQRQILSYTLCFCVYLFVLHCFPYLGCPLAGLGVLLRPNGVQDIRVGRNKSGV